MNYKGLVVVVLGGGGFIGSNLVRKLCACGGELRVYARSLNDELRGLEQSKMIKLYTGDISVPAVLAEVLDGANVVFCMIGASGASKSNLNPVDFLDTNGKVYLQILEGCRHFASGARVVYPSSRLVYAPQIENPVPEDALIRPASMYGLNKVFIEESLRLYAQNSGLFYTVLRVTNPYGPTQRSSGAGYSVVNWFIECVRKGNPISVYGDGSQLRDYIYIEDLLEALVEAATAESTKNQVINIGSGIGTSLVHMANSVVGIYKKGSVQHVPWPAADKAVETGDFVADITKAKKLMKWTPRTELKDGLQMTLKAEEGFRGRL